MPITERRWDLDNEMVKDDEPVTADFEEQEHDDVTEEEHDDERTPGIQGAGTG